MLSAPQAELAKDLLKNPYNFDFLTIGNDAGEKNLYGKARILAELPFFHWEIAITNGLQAAAMIFSVICGLCNE